MIAAQSLRFITNKAIIVWTSNSSFIPLDSGFRRNDGKEQCLKFVSPAKAGVQSRGLKRAVTQINDVYPIMDSLVTLFYSISFRTTFFWENGVQFPPF